MAGSNRSGNLRDAQNSIPKGTIAAIATTSLIYLSSVLLFGGTVNGDLLRDKLGESIGGSMLVANIAWPNKWVVLLGSFLSTVGAGLQSLTGHWRNWLHVQPPSTFFELGDLMEKISRAPRLLQAIANDNVIPILNVFGVVSKGGEPQRALLLTLIISEIGIIIASLDSVAPIITMFFLMCYGFVNFACTLQSLLRAPNWRPRFRFYSWVTSMLGVVLCLSMMFISSWYYTLVAILLAGFIYKYIEYRGAEKEWGDGLRGLSLNAARYSLLKLEEGQMHTKNWRPQILVFCKTCDETKEVDSKSRKALSLISQMKAGKGLIIVGSVVKGEYLSNMVEADEVKENIQQVMKKEKVKGFCKVVASRDVSEGLSYLIQNGGLGGLTPNTVVIGWPHDWKDNPGWRGFIHAVRVTSQRHEALVVVKDGDYLPSRKELQEGNVDIWWIVHDGGMMILMMFLLMKHKTWRKCNLRIFTVAQLEDNSIQMKKDLKKFLYNLRIAANVEVVEMLDNDISAYTYERTLKMEQRREMLNRMRLSKRESLNEGGAYSSKHLLRCPREHSHFQVQKIVEAAHRPRAESLIDPKDLENVGTRDTEGEKGDGVVIENIEVTENVELQEARKPREINLQRMNTAVKLNTVIKEKSQDSKLIMLNLPSPPRSSHEEEHYMEFIEVLAEGLQQVLMVRGGGHEVVTIYS